MFINTSRAKFATFAWLLFSNEIFAHQPALQTGAQAFAYPLDSVAAGLCVPTGINDDGKVVGYSFTSDDYLPARAFVTGPSGVGVSLLSLAGPDSAASSINAQGQVVGYATTDPQGLNSVPFVTDVGGVNMRAIDIPGAYIASGINDKGQVSGTLVRDGSATRAYLTGPGGSGYKILDTLDHGFTSAGSVNSAGQVIGSSQVRGEGGVNHGFITGPNGVGIKDLGLGGGRYNGVNDLNDRGQVTGTIIFDDNTRQQYVTGPNGEGLTPLGSLGQLPGGQSEGGGINNRGITVGRSSRGTHYGNVGAVVTDRQGRIWDLNKAVQNLPAGVRLVTPGGINNVNQVAVTGSDGKCYIVCPKEGCAK